MNKKHKVLLVILIGAIVAGSFYWFEYNPRQIRKGCANKNMEILQSRAKAGTDGEVTWQADEERNLYELCLNTKGLEK